MYFQKMALKAVGPVRDFQLEARFRADGSPIPIVIVGQNGAGKSLALSLIVDAATEMRRQCFRSIPEVKSDSYIRVSSKNYVHRDASFSHARINFIHETHELRFDEVVSKISYQDIVSQQPDLIRDTPSINATEFAKSGFHKFTLVAENLHRVVRETSFLYFPYFRYEQAHWMNENANFDFIEQKQIYGVARLNPVRSSLLYEMKLWILNLILDRELYEAKFTQVPVADGAGSFLNVMLGYSGPNDTMLALIHEVVTSMLQAKDPQITSARIGIGAKGNRSIAVHARVNDQEEFVVVPDLGQMSAGELLTLGLATEIIRSYELVSGILPVSLMDVKGIVVIDEADLHLHISFQKSVLPVIIRKLPNVQFIMSSHSPFFLLGMSESGEVDVYNLPIGNRIQPEEFSEFQASYDLFIEKNLQFKARYDELSAKIAEAGKPLIVTEGKTDWQHLKAALTYLKSQGWFSLLDIEFFEFDDEVTMGDVKLKQMCESVALLPQSRKTIFIFDRDVPKIVDTMSGSPGRFRILENSVFSFCIPVPPHRRMYENIAIEMYYTDSDLKTCDADTNKRLWFSNEIKIISEPGGGGSLIQAQATPNTVREFAKKVYDENIDRIQDEQGNFVGLSKAAFAAKIATDLSVSGHFNRSAFVPLFELIEEILGLQSPEGGPVHNSGV